MSIFIVIGDSGVDFVLLTKVRKFPKSTVMYIP